MKLKRREEIEKTYYFFFLAELREKKETPQGLQKYNQGINTESWKTKEDKAIVSQEKAVNTKCFPEVKSDEEEMTIRRPLMILREQSL